LGRDRRAEAARGLEAGLARRDYYAVLGVEKDASADDIKKSFRALALQYHPDRNPEDVDAEQRFREIVEAYQTLSDAEERSRYDRLGPFYRPDGRPPTAEDLNAFLAETFTGLFRRRRAAGRGEDLRYTLTVSLEDVASGTERTVEVNRMGRCRRCEGTGGDPDEGRRACDACEGSGNASNRRLFRSSCPRCDGRGFVVVKRCSRCGGDGRHEQREQLRVRVPAGVATGQKLKLKGKGNDPADDGATGDLLVLVNVEDHPLFQRRGPDLYCEVPVLYTEAALGADLRVPTLKGSTRIRIPAGTPSGKLFRLSGRGLQGLGGRSQGDLHIKVVVEVPESLGPAERAAIEELAGRLQAQAHPRRSAYDQLIDERSR
jgi:molecular chaperone DnaJ